MHARPNILWIVTTQWRAQAFGYAGDLNARTPNLDALAAESVNYTQAVTPHPFGPFARAAMLTGVPSPENGVRDYFDPLPFDTRTIAHEMNGRGYATAFFGKWHLAKRDPRAPLVGEAHAKMIVPPEARGGFEFWEGFESGFLLNDPWLHGSRLPEPVKFEGYQSDVVCRRAAEWIVGAGAGSKEHGAGERPWFAVVSLEAPHPPYDAPAAGVMARDPREIVLSANVPIGSAQGGSRGGEMEAQGGLKPRPTSGEVEAKARRELAGYYAHIEATDRAMGELIGRVDAEAARRGYRAPIVVFTSVHGDMHGAHGLFRKGWPYEESVRVPLLIRGQRAEDGGQRTDGGGRRTEDRERKTAPRDSDLTRDRDRDSAGGGEAGARLRLRAPSREAENGGRRDDSAVSLVDLPAMTTGWADGRTAVPSATLRAGGARRYSSISMPSVVTLPHQCDRTWRGVRTAKRKLVLNDDGSPWLFFDLENDPLEMQNLVGDAGREQEIAELRALISEP